MSKGLSETIFLSSEAWRDSGNIIREIRNKNVEPKIINILPKNYGSKIIYIGIITICVLKHQEKDWTERRLIQWKQNGADIRLHMNYDKFMNGNEEQRYLMYCKNIIDSLKVVRDRCKKDLRGQDLIDDVMNALEITETDLNEIEKYIES